MQLNKQQNTGQNFRTTFIRIINHVARQDAARKHGNKGKTILSFRVVFALILFCR